MSPDEQIGAAVSVGIFVAGVLCGVGGLYFLLVVSRWIGNS